MIFEVTKLKVLNSVFQKNQHTLLYLLGQTDVNIYNCTFEDNNASILINIFIFNNDSQDFNINLSSSNFISNRGNLIYLDSNGKWNFMLS